MTLHIQCHKIGLNLVIFQRRGLFQEIGGPIDSFPSACPPPTDPAKFPQRRVQEYGSFPSSLSITLFNSA